MAAGRDIARATKIIRKRQAAVNAAALAEEERRRTEAEAIGAMKPSEIRRMQTDARRRQREEMRLVRAGASVVEIKLDRTRYEDKMDRGAGGSGDKNGEGGGEGLDGGEGDSGEGGEKGGGEGSALTREQGVPSRGESREGEADRLKANYASIRARDIAENDPRLTREIFDEYVPSSEHGFTKADVIEILEEISAKEMGD